MSSEAMPTLAPPSARPRWMARFFVVLSVLFLVLYAFPRIYGYLYVHVAGAAAPGLGFLFPISNFRSYHPETLFAVHIVVGAVALVAALVNLIPYLAKPVGAVPRALAPGHRIWGVAFLIASWVGAVTGGWLTFTMHQSPSLHAEAAILVTAPLFLLAVFWFMAVTAGALAVIRQNYTAHIQWLAVTAVVILTFVTGRLLGTGQRILLNHMELWTDVRFTPFEMTLMLAAVGWFVFVLHIGLAIYFYRAIARREAWRHSVMSTALRAGA